MASEPKRERESHLQLRLSADERIMLTTLADGRGLSYSDFVRQAIRADFARFAKEHGKTAAECLETVRHRSHPRTDHELSESLTDRRRRLAKGRTK